MSWTYQISTGRWMFPSGTLLAFCYSGAPGHVNVAADVALPDLGPIPPGRYTIGPVIPVHPELGEYVMPLEPDPANVMYGRSGLAFHGDNQLVNYSASKGCIVGPRPARERVGENLATDNQLEVVP